MKRDTQYPPTHSTSVSILTHIYFKVIQMYAIICDDCHQQLLIFYSK